eukprot:1144077-Pelagomonas_calceolata.AAC.9
MPRPHMHDINTALDLLLWVTLTTYRAKQHMLPWQQKEKGSASSKPASLALLDRARQYSVAMGQHLHKQTFSCICKAANNTPRLWYNASKAGGNSRSAFSNAFQSLEQR